MRIEHYSWGKITVDGRSFTSDVIIYPGRVDSSWWRKEGHLVQVADLAEVVNALPEVLVIGTGALGVMKVPEETMSHLEAKGIEVHVRKTGKAVELFNELQKRKKAVAALHLTC
jgi:hypothetical protein